MKTAFSVAVVVAASAITCGIFGVATPVQARTNSSDTGASGMSTYLGGDIMMRNMLHERSENHKWGMILAYKMMNRGTQHGLLQAIG
jgi:hypothetical protein